MAAVIAAVILAALVLFGGGEEDYTVKARFINAGQLVNGNLVEIGGTKVGSLTGFEITPDGQAEVEMTINDDYAPLREGTKATIRQGSQSSTANRYIELFLPPENEAGEEIEAGGEIGIDRTTTVVDLDQLFNTLDKPTRKALRGFYKGSARSYAGRGDQLNRGLLYLSPALAASTRLFDELRKEPPVLQRFLVDSSRLVTSLAERRDDLSALVGNLNDTTRALGDRKLELAEVVERFPDFMRTANTTYVNLRNTLDDVDPFVKASKPVAKKLRPFLRELRPFARDARPTVRDLSRLVRLRGADNDLFELNRTFPPLADIAVETRQRNGKDRRGAFPELSEALRKSAPIVAHGRPYTVDLLGWFDDFSHTGTYDALGSFSRAQVYLNPFSVSNGIPQAIPTSAAADSFRALVRTNQFKRCPGASEEPAADGSNVFSESEQHELDCREDARATGPIR